MRAEWTDEETELFKRHYPVKTASQLKEIFPQYSRQQMLTKAVGLGIKKGKEIANQSRRESFTSNPKMAENIWSDEEKRILLEVYPLKGLLGVKEALGEKRTTKAITKMVRRLKLTRSNNSLIWERTGISIDIENGTPTFEVTYKGW